MRVGGHHRWYYRLGEWEETKITPDKWQFSYDAKKRRKWNAPEGSGAPTGTEYHWYVLAHQNVRKLNANEYSTSMTGVKYKLAHRRAGNEEWSVNGRAQLRQLVAILEENITQLRHELGEVNGDPRATRRETDFPAMTNLGPRVMIGGRKVQPNSLPLGMLGQPPLEMYIPQTVTAGAEASASPSVGSNSSPSSKSEFLPKNNR
jgi:hypothetical protein